MDSRAVCLIIGRESCRLDSSPSCQRLVRYMTRSTPVPRFLCSCHDDAPPKHVCMVRSSQRQQPKLLHARSESVLYQHRRSFWPRATRRNCFRPTLLRLSPHTPASKRPPCQVYHSHPAQTAARYRTLGRRRQLCLVPFAARPPAFSKWGGRPDVSSNGIFKGTRQVGD